MNKQLYAKIKSFFDINGIKFKTTIFVILVVYLLIIFKISLMRFNTTDVIPPFKPITTEVLKTLGQFTVRVKVGMFVKGFHVFDAIKNTFLVDSVIWFEFNGDEIMLEVIEKFSFDNGKIVSKSSPDLRVVNERIFVKYNVLFELKTDLSFHKFPFEDHRLPIVLTNDFVTPAEMVFVVEASSFQMLPKVFPSGWKLTDLNVDAGFVPIILDGQDVNKRAENPKVLFIVNFAKASCRKALVIFMPLFSVMFLSLLSFFVSHSNISGIFSIAVTAVTALLGYRFVIEQMMPQVGYFTTTDLLYLFLLMSAFFVFLFQLLFTRYYTSLHETFKPESVPHETLKKLESVSSIVFIIMSFLLAAVTTYMILL